MEKTIEQKMKDFLDHPLLSDIFKTEILSDDSDLLEHKIKEGYVGEIESDFEKKIISFRHNLGKEIEDQNNEINILSELDSKTLSKEDERRLNDFCVEVNLKNKVINLLSNLLGFAYYYRTGTEMADSSFIRKGFELVVPIPRKICAVKE